MWEYLVSIGLSCQSESNYGGGLMYILKIIFSKIQFSSVTQSCPTLCDPMDCSTPGLPVYHQLPEPTWTHVCWVGDAIQPPHPLLTPSSPASIFPSIRVFSNESVLRIRWPKYWSSSFSISPSNGYSVLISFRMDWLDLLAVQGTLKSLLQHHSSKASIFWCSAFFIVQLSHPYMIIGKTIALIRKTFVGKVVSLLFNMLSRFVITFLRRSKRLLISWLLAKILLAKADGNFCIYSANIYWELTIHQALVDQTEVSLSFWGSERQMDVVKNLNSRDLMVMYIDSDPGMTTFYLAN